MNHVSRLCFTATLFFAICASTLEIHAQQVIDFDERLPKDRPEFWAMKLVGSELLMTAMGPPDAIEPGQIELGIEAGWLPSLNQEQRMIGFSGTKEEHVNRTPVFARPRASFGLPHDIRVAVGYVPPFRIDGIRPNVLTLSAGRPVFSTTFWRIGVRAHGLLGNLSGDITCDRDTVAAGEDLVRNPYRCEVPSNDKMTIRAGGVEVSNAFRVWRAAEPYVTVGVNYFDTKFRTDARYSGLIDRSRLLGAGPAFALGGGLSYRFSGKTRLSGEVFYTPLEVRRFLQPRINDGLVNVRLMLAYELR